MTYILYNPLANNSTGEESARALPFSEGARLVDIRRIGDFVSYLKSKSPSDTVIVTGGDGTLHRLVNALGGFCPANPLYYYPTGTANDFARDIPEDQKKDGLILLNPYISHLPKVTVNGEERYFLNGVGYGIDGYCCEEADRLRLRQRADAPPKPINYSLLAIKGLLLFFRPRNAMVVVDGEEFVFPKAWLAPTMKGRHYGGGMLIAPKQDRRSLDEELTFTVVYGLGRIRTLMLFPAIFKGEHIYHSNVKLIKGKRISVFFDKPTALQIDGETFRGVTSYTVSAQSEAEENETKENKEKEPVC